MADMEKIKQLMEDGEKVGAVRKQVEKLQTAMDELVAVLGGSAPKVKKEKLDHPKPGSAPAKLCKVMGKTPQTAEQVGKKVKPPIKPATCKIYFSKFACFQNVRGKGYIYKRPTTTTTEKKTTKKKGKKKS